jgi:hypothetical protein
MLIYLTLNHYQMVQNFMAVYDYNKETLACSRHDIADKLLIFGAKQDAQYYNNNKETCK